MGILERFTDIIKANINDLLDKAEDPAKMIDQYLRDLTENLAEVKRETAGVMAEEARTRRMVEDNEVEVKKYDDLARKALAAGNEGDARTFLGKKQQLEGKSASLKATYDAAHENAQKMRQMHDKLVGDIENLNSRREMIKAKVAVAKTQEKVNGYASSADKAAGAMNAFDRMERKADQMLDRANAMSELNQKPVDEAAALEAKYAASGASASVDAELEKLKKDMGL
ncbi:PspA/IM30 family protein [Agathobaculum sp. NTUH-O15-33]|uniref:PspA/IM30 family protein n=1 Tax=Agathobaculum sp. NTUH-O15-33 TaxID=3079302 RepID=UPI002958DCA8|nr:PspA/IM30 family protein [Agathobaculum sp. NTUH-O15-33]WNX84901.1 PspA/IM30 family protein [Agathobaculum sp. NTUH-O15-33]